MWNNNMAKIAQVGQKIKLTNLPTLDLAGAIDNYYNAKDAADARAKAQEEAQRRQAMVDELTEQHPEAAAQIAADPMAFAKYLQDQANAERDQQFKMDYLARQNANAIGLAKVKAQLDAQNAGGDTNAIRNVAAMVSAGYTPQEAWAMYYGGQNPTLDVSMLGKKGQEAYDKKMGEVLGDEAIAQRQLKTLQPKAENALKRAKESLANGYGLGQIGGKGWTNEQGGINRGNIKAAQAQINTTMRGLLKQLGVGSTELNSAAEAEAYRYMLSPDMPIGQQMQVIKNFEEDYLSGALAKDLSQIYGNKQESATNYKNKYGLE